jgi:hypothetical protein
MKRRAGPGAGGGAGRRQCRAARGQAATGAAGAARRAGGDAAAGRLPAVAGAVGRHVLGLVPGTGGRRYWGCGAACWRVACAGAGQCGGRFGERRRPSCWHCARWRVFGFLLASLPAPSLIRRLVARAAPERHAGPVGRLHAAGRRLALLAGPVDRAVALARLVVAGAAVAGMAVWVGVVPVDRRTHHPLRCSGRAGVAMVTSGAPARHAVGARGPGWWR